MDQLVEWSYINSKVGDLRPDSSWPYVDVSLVKTLNLHAVQKTESSPASCASAGPRPA